jgi:predicted nucleotidyltransferase
VRGDFTGDSDFDVLVIVKDKDVRTETALIELFGEKEDFTGIPFSVVIKDKQTYDREKRFRTGFARGIEDEGITIYKKEN